LKTCPKCPIETKRPKAGRNKGRPRCVKNGVQKEKKLDTSKTCKYCIDVKRWKGIGHTEPECFTKGEAGKRSKKVDAGSDEEEDGNNRLTALAIPTVSRSLAPEQGFYINERI